MMPCRVFPGSRRRKMQTLPGIQAIKVDLCFRRSLSNVSTDLKCSEETIDLHPKFQRYHL